MKKYPTIAIHHLTRHIMRDTPSFNWLINNGYDELIAMFDAVRDDKAAFKLLMNSKQFILAAFVNAIWDDSQAFQLLWKSKAFEWAATANLINGDDSAEVYLKKVKKEEYVLLAHAIQSRIHEDGDRNIGPVAALKNIFDLKKAFKKED